MGGANSDTWVPFDYHGSDGYWMNISTHPSHWPGKLSVLSENNSWGIDTTTYSRFKNIIYYIDDEESNPINQRKGYLVKIKNDGSYVSTTTWYNAANTRVKDLTIDLSNNVYVGGHKTNLTKDILYFPKRIFEILLSSLNLTKKEPY